MSDDNQDSFDEDVEEDEPIDERSVATMYLKEIAKDNFATPWDKIAEEMDLPRSRADSIIKQLVQTMVGTHKENNFPTRILEHYNKFAEKESEMLTVEDIVILMRLINRYMEKIKPKDMEKIQDRMQKLSDDNSGRPHYKPGMDPQRDAKPVPEIPHTPHARVTMTDSYNNNSGPPASLGQAPNQNQYNQQPQQDSYSPYESDESLMKYLLEMNYSIRDPDRIRHFLQGFKMNKNDWLANPYKLLVALNSAFPKSAAEATMMQFMDARTKMGNSAASLSQITGASDYKPIIDPRTYLGQVNPAMGDFMNQLGNQFGINPFGPNPGAGAVNPNQAEDPADKEFNRLTKIMGLSMMRTMAQQSMGQNGQQGQGAGMDPSLYDYVDHYDQNTGRFVKREWIRKGFGYGPAAQSTNPSDKSAEMMIKFMEAMMTTANSDRQLLLQKLLSGDSQGGMASIMETMLKQLAGAMTQTIDPSVALTKYLDLGEKVAALKQQPQKSTEERRLEMDFLLAKQEMAAKEAEKSREFQRQQEEAHNADARYQDTVKEVGSIIKEAAGPAIEIFKNTLGHGLGGQMPGMFPPGYPPQQQQQQQQQPQRVVVMQPEPQQQQPQYTPEQIRLLQQQEQMRRAQIAQAQYQQQQEEEDTRPIEQVLAEVPDDQLDEMASRFEGDLTKLEHMGNKVMAERARRKGHGFVPRRDHVAPVVQAIRAHEEEQQQQYQPEYPQEESINPFEDVDTTANTSATSSAVDFSDAYNDENVREAMKVDGTLSENDEQNDEYTNINENQSIGVPASASMPPTQSREQVQEPETIEIDESAMNDGDTVIEQ